MIVHLQHCYVAFACGHLVSTYFSYFILGKEFDHQVVGRSHSLPRVKGRLSYYGIVCRQAIDNKGFNIPSDFLRIITNCHKQHDCAEGVYFYPSEPNERGVGWD